MPRTSNSIIPTFAKHSSLSSGHLPHQDAPCQLSLVVEAKRAGFILTSAQDIKLHHTNNFCKALISLKCHLPLQDSPCQQCLGVESWRSGGHPDRSFDSQDTQLHSVNNFCYALISEK